MQLPITDFYLRKDGDWDIKTSKEIFLGKRTVLVMVPGAFTPTCSNQQVPEFEKAYDKIAAKGVDQVIVMSVNDAFVMDAWKKDLKCKKLTFIADGNGTFTNGLKAAVSKTNKGMGARSWRLALVINENGMVEWGGIEDGQRAEATNDPYEKSTPEQVLFALDQLAQAEADAAAADSNIEELTKAAEALGADVIHVPV